MKNLTKQWFDEANKDSGHGKDKESKVTTSKKSTYHKLNTANASSILLDSSEDEELSENEQVIIDKTKFLNAHI